MKYLVTGATGTLGKALVSLLLGKGHEVVGLSRDEQKHLNMPNNSNLKMILGDVSDSAIVLKAALKVDQIFHLAAFKCLHFYEDQPMAAVQTNIIGTQNIISAQMYTGLERVTFTSTDKACYPINVYGNTKAIGEKIILTNPFNVVCRYGNVLGSRGSVVRLFVEKILKGESVPITSPLMNRFFIPIESAAEFVFESSQAPKGGMFIPKMKATAICRLAETIALILQKPKPEICEIPLRPGEKYSEVLQTAHEGELIESSAADQFTDAELERILVPIVFSIKKELNL